MSLNPEFRRNLLLQLSAQRLIAAPAVLAIVFGLVFTVSTDTMPLAWLSRWGFLLFALLWGTRRAADAVAEEVNGGTWDGQRMSALGAWSMAWGKLLGSTIYTWYCGVLCLAVHAAARASSVDGLQIVADLVQLVEAALIGQAVAMGITLALWRKRMGRRPLRWAAGQLVGIAAGIAVSARGPDIPGDLALIPDWRWYGVLVDHTLFAVVSLAVFFGWALLGVYRIMLQELQYRTWPWAWTLFVLFCLAYIGGFAFRGFETNLTMPTWPLTASSLAIAFLYIALFIEPKSPIRYRQFLGALRRADGATTLSTMPLWLPTWLIAAACLIVVLTTRGDSIYTRDLTPAVAVALLLFMLRDIAFVLALNFGRSPGRADMAAFLYLVIAYVPLGWLLSRLEQPLVAAFVMPVLSTDPLITIAPVAVELVLAAGFLWYRWTRHGVPRVAARQPSVSLAAGA